MPDNEVLMIPLCDVDTEVIRNLDDEPNDVGGLTAQELKTAFDSSGEGLKTYINETLIPQIIAADATEQARAGAESVRETQEAQRQANETVRQSNETTRQTQEAAREAAEAARANENSGIVARATAQAEAAETSAQEAFRSMMNAGMHVNRAMMYADDALNYRDDAVAAADSADRYRQQAALSSSSANQSASQAISYGKAAESFARGGTGRRAGENTDNAKYYKEQSETIYNNVDRRFRVGLDNGLLCAKNINLTLTAAGWSASEPYVQTVNVGTDALIADQAGHAFLSPGATDAQYAEACRCIIRLQGATTSTVTFRAAAAKPTVDIPVTLELHFTPEALSASYATQADIEALTASDVGAIPATEKGALGGVATLGSDGKIPSAQLPALDFVPTEAKGVPNGVATLDGLGQIPRSQLPALNFVPTLRRINGKSLGDDISLNASDVGARASNWTPLASDLPTVPISKGGTGANTKAGAKAALEVPDLPLSVANGGTGAVNAAGARENLGLGDYETVKGNLAALMQDVGSGGNNCRITYGSYVGTGTSGRNHPNSLTFNFYPMFIIIMSRAAQGRDQSPCFMMRGETVGNSTKTAASINLIWSDNGVSWYDVDSFSKPENQNNTEGVTYHYIALGYGTAT